MTSLDPGPIVLAMLLGLAAAVFALQLALRRNQAPPPPRAFRRSRMFRMLGLRGIAPRDYLSANSAANVKLHLRLCEDCTDSRRCDSTARAGGVDDFGYCPNGATLDRLQRSGVAIGRQRHFELPGHIARSGSTHRRSTR